MEWEVHANWSVLDIECEVVEVWKVLFTSAGERYVAVIFELIPQSLRKCVMCNSVISPEVNAPLCSCIINLPSLLSSCRFQEFACWLWHVTCHVRAQSCLRMALFFTPLLVSWLFASVAKKKTKGAVTQLRSPVLSRYPHRVVHTVPSDDI